MDISRYANLTTLADRLKTIRILKGLTQEDLAVAAGIKQQSIQAIESGKTKMPTADILFKIARRLEVSPAWLAFGTEAIDNLSDQAIRIATAYDSSTDEETKRIIEKLLHVNNTTQK